jgi:hypothetical protein
VNIRYIISCIFVLACVCSAQTAEVSANEPEFHLYVAIFGVTVGTDSKIQDFRVVKVIEPLAGKNALVQVVELPGEYIDAARKQVEAENIKPALKDGKPSEELTMFLYTPRTQQASPAVIEPISFGSLNGTMAHIISFKLTDQSCQSSTFGRDLGKSALFLTYYAIPIAKDSKDERESVINAEIERCMGNFGNGKLISKKDLSMADQTIVEVVAKSPRSKTMSLRCRFICSSTMMLALTAVTPDDQDEGDMQTSDKMFDGFHFY